MKIMVQRGWWCDRAVVEKYYRFVINQYQSEKSRCEEFSPSFCNLRLLFLALLKLSFHPAFSFALYSSFSFTSLALSFLWVPALVCIIYWICMSSDIIDAVSSSVFHFFVFSLAFCKLKKNTEFYVVHEKRIFIELGLWRRTYKF